MLLALPLACEARSAVTPIQKVLDMLEGMKEKAIEGQKGEQVQWTKYRQWCGDAESAKQEVVKKNDLKIEDFSAEVERLEAAISEGETEIASRQQGITARQEDHHKATTVRKEERDSYTALHKDFSESIHAVTEAIRVLKEQDFARPGAAAATPAVAAALLQRFGGASAADALLAAVGAEPPVAHAYEFQSDGVITLLTNLQDDFRSRLLTLEKETLNKQHEYETLAQDLTSQIKLMEHEIGQLSEQLAIDKQGRAEAAAALARLKESRETDIAFLQELASTCKQKSIDFEARDKLRTEELQALGQAIEIISGSAVAGAADKHLPSFAQGARGTALLQVLRFSAAGPSNRTSANVSKVASFLKSAGAKIKSQALTALASKLSVSEDPFAKVRELIQQLIERLKAEEAEEAQHKAWCDGEMAVNEQTRTTKTNEVEGLHTTIDELEGQLSVLARDLAGLSREVADLTTEMGRLAKIRAEDQAKNEETIADAAGAQLALADALKVLKDFYGKAAGTTSLVQSKGHQEPPPIFDEGFKGQQTAGSNVLAFLEVIQSDFVRLGQETAAAEATAKEDYDKTVLQSEADLTEKNRLINEKSAEQSQKSQDLVTARSDLELAQGELDTALAYFDKLKPSCVGAVDAASSAGASSERVQRRESELQALKEALEILNGEAIGINPGVEGLYSSVDGGNYGNDVK